MGADPSREHEDDGSGHDEAAGNSSPAGERPSPTRPARRALRSERVAGAGPPPDRAHVAAQRDPLCRRDGASATELTTIMKSIEKPPVCPWAGYDPGMEVEPGGTQQPIRWMSTRDACERLGVTLRTLYRFIDEGQLPAYKMGRVIRLQGTDIESFIVRMRIEPGTLEHLYPEPKGHERGAGGAGDAVGDEEAAVDAESVEADA
jgi:excisionase family DNA binding protein